MIVKKSTINDIVIDLTGPDGNVFVLMGYASSIGRKLGMGPETDNIIEDMMSGDYENAVTVFDNAFGDFITLLR